MLVEIEAAPATVLAAITLVIAAVRWSCRGRRDPMAPTFRCGLFRWNFSLAISS